MNASSPTAPAVCTLALLLGAAIECDECGSSRPFCELRPHETVIHPDQSGFVCKDAVACDVRAHVRYHRRFTACDVVHVIRHCAHCTAGTSLLASSHLTLLEIGRLLAPVSG